MRLNSSSLTPFTRRGLVLLAACIALATTSVRAADAPETCWYKGNTHTHTWWSDGDSPPEIAVGWYREHGYNFLVLSDHNILSEGEKWVDLSRPKRADAAKTYEQKYGPDWIRKRERDGKTEYRLKTLAEFRPLFEKPGEFLMIPGEEISDSFEKKPIHVNAINVKEVIPPPHGKTFFETVQNNINAVLAQRERTGQPMFPHINHPNFGWAFTVEDFFELKGEKFFEVYNGHPTVYNAGDERRASMDRLWDIVLTKRLAELHLPVIYGVATDDAHSYTQESSKVANPGRGWVWVRSSALEPSAIVQAMEKGDFYASTGVELQDIQFRGGVLAITIKPQDGVTYRTQFIGTLTGYDPKATSQPTGENERISMKYSDSIGRVLAEVEGTSARYKLTGKEIYVRAKVISDRVHPNALGEKETAWTQPVRPEGASGGIR